MTGDAKGPYRIHGFHLLSGIGKRGSYCRTGERERGGENPIYCSTVKRRVSYCLRKGRKRSRKKDKKGAKKPYASKGRFFFTTQTKGKRR